MKHVLALLFAAFIAQGAHIYTEPIRLMGGGRTSVNVGGNVDAGLSLELYGSSSEARVDLSYSWYEFTSVYALWSIHPGTWGSTFHQFAQPYSRASLGDFTSHFFSYYIGGSRGGMLTLYDAAWNELASAPIIAYFDYRLVEYSVFPNGGLRIVYDISVLPTPEPAAWQLGLLGLPPFFVLARRRRNPLYRTTPSTGLLAVAYSFFGMRPDK
jgi:hypothetical protein